MLPPETDEIAGDARAQGHISLVVSVGEIQQHAEAEKGRTVTSARETDADVNQVTGPVG